MLRFNVDRASTLSVGAAKFLLERGGRYDVYVDAPARRVAFVPANDGTYTLTKTQNPRTPYGWIPANMNRDPGTKYTFATETIDLPDGPAECLTFTY